MTRPDVRKELFRGVEEVRILGWSSILDTARAHLVPEKEQEHEDFRRG